MTDYATVKLWGHSVGYLAWNRSQGLADFEYEFGFVNQGIDISPFYMSIDEAKRANVVFSFPENRNGTYLGLPGIFADALPDKFGNRVINTWLPRNGRTPNPNSFTPIERLCYMGTRGMGALEFFPSNHPIQLGATTFVEIDQLVQLTQDIMDERNNLDPDTHTDDKEQTKTRT